MEEPPYIATIGICSP